MLALTAGLATRQNQAVGPGGRLCAVIGASSAAMLLFAIGSAVAAPGDLDPTFGRDGIAETTPGIANVMALQPDGKIVLGGLVFPFEFALARYTPDGQLDHSFGSGGAVAGPSGSVRGLAIQSDGRIVVTGYTPAGLMSVVRYTAGGA